MEVAPCLEFENALMAFPEMKAVRVLQPMFSYVMTTNVLFGLNGQTGRNVANLVEVVFDHTQEFVSMEKLDNLVVQEHHKKKSFVMDL